MKKPLSIFLVGISAVTLLDSLGAIASRQLNFNYSLLSFVSFIFYVGFAFFLTRQADKKTTIVLTGLLGLFDATIGWKLSELLGANTAENKIEITTTILITTAIFMTIFASLLGLLGWWLSKKISKTNDN
ncbi:MAG: hypothetical protein MUE81_22490 [Thermoflexibacter sp.]|nr:hypothetical protein [Thermoflexibacter sp.]